MKINFKKLDYRKGTVALVVDSIGEILVVQKHSFKPNEWDFPGGGIDKNEKAEETVLRELKEELGSDKFAILKKDKSLDKYDWSTDYILWRFNKFGKTYKGQQRVRFLVEFFGQREEIKIQESEIRKYMWVKIKDLKEYLIFSGQFEKIQKALKEFGIGE